MRTQSIPQMRVISGNTPQETALLFNEAETLSEKYELAGKTAHCIECPKCIRDVNRFGYADTRKMWATCGATGERVRLDSRACDTYYAMMEKGGNFEK